MNKLDKRLIKSEHFVSKEGQRDLLSSNKESHRCPSLDYKYVISPENRINRAFDLLFEEVMKIK